MDVTIPHIKAAESLIIQLVLLLVMVVSWPNNFVKVLQTQLTNLKHQDLTWMTGSGSWFWSASLSLFVFHHVWCTSTVKKRDLLHDTRQANKVILLSGYNSSICGIINRSLRRETLIVKEFKEDISCGNLFWVYYNRAIIIIAYFTPFFNNFIILTNYLKGVLFFSYNKFKRFGNIWT